jgi:hypothetical protein
VFKLIVCTKRKTGLTREAFREIYERDHVPLILRVTPAMRGYRRNYLAPNAEYGMAEEGPFDCVTEAWFDGPDDYRAHHDMLAAQPETVAQIAASEARVFDRAKTQVFFATVEGEGPVGS